MAYQMIGGDGKEYGPYTAEDIRRLVTDGRADAQTQLRSDDTAAWSTIGSHAEFADLLAPNATLPAPPPQPPPPPPPGTPCPDITGKQEIPTGEYDLNIGYCVSRAWGLLMSDFWSILGVYLLYILIVAGVNSIPGLSYVAWVFSGVFAGGLWFFLLNKIRGRNAEMSDLFIGFKQPLFVPLLLVGLVITVLTLIGFICCILPGIYLSIAWVLAVPLVADRRLDFWSAMETSRKVITRHWWLWLGFMLVLGCLVLAGVLALCIGVFVAAPLTSLALAYAYEDLFGQTAQTEKPGVNQV